MAIVTVGIDLAKNVFAVHGVDEAGKLILQPVRWKKIFSEWKKLTALVWSWLV